VFYYGIVDSYNDYLKYKNLFIENILFLNLYTITIKEIIKFFDDKINLMIDYI
jgi:hypothetical protein